jgi:platelet-activating factor acetylhydrolase
MLGASWTLSPNTGLALVFLSLISTEQQLVAVKSKHESFSDFLVFPIIRSSAAVKIMDVLGMLCLAFLDGNLEDALASLSTRTMTTKVVGKKKDGRPKRALVGEVGDVVVH